MGAFGPVQETYLWRLGQGPPRTDAQLIWSLERKGRSILAVVAEWQTLEP